MGSVCSGVGNLERNLRSEVVARIRNLSMSISSSIYTRYHKHI